MECVFKFASVISNKTTTVIHFRHSVKVREMSINRSNLELALPGDQAVELDMRPTTCSLTIDVTG